MKEIPISVFRSKCCEILERVRRTRTPILVTRFGQPIAKIVPISPTNRSARRLGSIVGKGRILGDIVGPTGSLDDWGGDAENVFSSKT